MRRAGRGSQAEGVACARTLGQGRAWGIPKKVAQRGYSMLGEGKGGPGCLGSEAGIGQCRNEHLLKPPVRGVCHCSPSGLRHCHLWPSRARGGITLNSASVFTGPPSLAVGVSAPYFPSSYKDTSHWIRATLIQGDPS